MRYNVNYALRQIRCQPIVDPEFAFAEPRSLFISPSAVIIVNFAPRNASKFAATAAIFDRKYHACHKILHDPYNRDSVRRRIAVLTVQASLYRDDININI